MGYEANEIRYAKQSIIRLLSRIGGANYKHINHNELMDNKDLSNVTIMATLKSDKESDLVIMDRLKNPSSNNLKYLFVDSDAFEKLINLYAISKEYFKK